MMSAQRKVILFIALLSVLFLVGCASTNQESSSATPSGLSGKLVKMNPDRAMAGAPCHVMGGEIMGDCDTREINLEAWQWDWSEPTLTVRTGELVRIKATSRDVKHGMAIPELGFNIQINPGEETVGEFLAPKPGEYAYGCSVMCGSGHGEHTGKLVVVE